MLTRRANITFLFGPLVTIYFCYNLYHDLVGNLSLFCDMYFYSNEDVCATSTWPLWSHLSKFTQSAKLDNASELLPASPWIRWDQVKTRLTSPAPLLIVQQERRRHTRWKSDHLRLSCSSRSLLNLTCSSASCFFTFSFRATARKLCDEQIKTNCGFQIYRKETNEMRNILEGM